MQLSAKFSALFSILFAATCLWFAVDAFTSTGFDPEQPPSSEFAWFWVFLAVVGLGLAFVLWKVSGMQLEDKDT